MVKVKPCASCGNTMEYANGNQQYHPECRVAVKREAVYRHRKRNPAQVAEWDAKYYQTRLKPRGDRLYRRLDRMFTQCEPEARPELARKILEWKPADFLSVRQYVMKRTSLDEDWLYLAEEL